MWVNCVVCDLYLNKAVPIKETSFGSRLPAFQLLWKIWCPETRIWVQVLYLERYPRKHSQEVGKWDREGREANKGDFGEMSYCWRPLGLSLLGPLRKAVERPQLQNCSSKGRESWFVPMSADSLACSTEKPNTLLHLSSHHSGDSKSCVAGPRNKDQEIYFLLCHKNPVTSPFLLVSRNAPLIALKKSKCGQAEWEEASHDPWTEVGGGGSRWKEFREFMWTPQISMPSFVERKKNCHFWE